MGTTRRDNVIRAARGVVALLWRAPNGDVGFPDGRQLSVDLALRELWDTVRFEQAAVVPTVVCLCGSTRFWRQFQRSSLDETMAGRIVLSIGAATGTDDEHFGNLPREEYDRVKEMLDTLHLRKLDLCDEALILNVDDYVGQSTMRELGYARAAGKRVRWLLPSRHALDGEAVPPRFTLEERAAVVEYAVTSQAQAGVSVTPWGAAEVPREAEGRPLPRIGEEG